MANSGAALGGLECPTPRHDGLFRGASEPKSGELIHFDGPQEHPADTELV
jgi:hypothetical protein